MLCRSPPCVSSRLFSLKTVSCSGNHGDQGCVHVSRIVSYCPHSLVSFMAAKRPRARLELHDAINRYDVAQLKLLVDSGAALTEIDDDEHIAIIGPIVRLRDDVNPWPTK